MRISDWSSDVCSSDLDHGRSRRFGQLVAVTRVGQERELAGAGAGQRRHGGNPGFAVAAKFEPEARGDLGGGVGRPGHGLLAGAALERAAESELQALELDRKSTRLNSSH